MTNTIQVMNSTDDQPSDESPIDRLIERHGMDRAEAREIVSELQAGADEPIFCEVCEEYAEPDENLFVRHRELPDRTAAMCNECYALLLEEETRLSEKEAVLVVLIEDGLSYREAGGVIGYQNASSAVARAREKLDEAHRTVQYLDKLRKL